MDIRDTYVFQNKIDDFGEYHTPKYYEEGGGPVVKQAKSPTGERPSFISETQNIAKKIPGVGQYVLNPEIKQNKSKKKIQPDFKKLQHKGTHTYVDDIIKDKKKIPAVGKYDVVVDNTQEIRKKYKQKGDIMRKKSPIFRPTIMEEINITTLKVASNQYNVLKPLGYKSPRGKIQPEHQRSASLPRLPGAGDYQPIPVTYETFSKKASLSKLDKKSMVTTFGMKNKERVENRSPGPKYSLISDWVEKKDKTGNKKGINYVKHYSSMKSQSVYH